MLEHEWLASDDPGAMLRLVSIDRPASMPLGFRKASDRKLRLFACGCCRLVWDRLDARSREAVACAEAWADDTADDRGRAALAHTTATGCLTPDPAGAARRPLRYSVHCGLAPAAQAALLRDLCGNPWRPVVLRCQYTGNMVGTDTRPAGRPCPCWACSPPPAVLALARAAYDERQPDGLLDPDRLAVLADALEDAGAGTVGLLTHLRSPGPHVRGCWAIDLVLGKE
jgi:hypothetical protein